LLDYNFEKVISKLYQNYICTIHCEMVGGINTMVFRVHGSGLVVDGATAILRPTALLY